MTKERGFTLMEMVLAMGIMAILATVATTTYFGYRNRAILDREGTKAVAYFREALTRAEAQQGVEGTTSTIWAINIYNTSTSDYYELLIGGVGGTSIDRVYLRPGITFTATTSSVTRVLVGGATTTPLSTAINFGFVVTSDNTLTEEISIGTNGKITRTKSY